MTGRDAEKFLDRAGISLNRKHDPQRPRTALAGVRGPAGHGAETTAGMGPGEMATVAELIVRALKGGEEEIDPVRREVRELTSHFPPYSEQVQLPQQS